MTQQITTSHISFSSALNPCIPLPSQVCLKKSHTLQLIHSNNRRMSLLDGSLFPEILLFAGGTFLVTTIAFWGTNALLLFLDFSNGPLGTWIRRYKIQENVNTPPNPRKLKSAISLVLFNQTAVAIPLFLILYPISKWRGITIDVPFPSTLSFIWQFIVCIIVEEIGFYYSHRLFHHPLFYSRFHKKHHEWTAPIGLISIHAHPVEHVIANLMPPYLGVFIAGSGLKFAWFWFAFALIFTSNSHSGYHFPFLPSAEAHDFHHAKFNNCFGVLGILDYLHGTDKQFRETINFKRHRTTWTTVPVKELYPTKGGNNTPCPKTICPKSHSTESFAQNKSD